MLKSQIAFSALLLTVAVAAHAETTSSTTTNTTSTTGSQGAASVQRNLDANKSDGKADKGLMNAEAHITADHGKHKGDKNDAKREEKKERTEKHEHMDHEHVEHDHAERPAKPERPGR